MNKLKSIFVSLLVFVGLEVLIKKQEWFWWIVLGLVVLVLGTCLTIVKFSRGKRLNFIILPALYITGVLNFFIFLQEGILRHIYIFGACSFLGMLLLNVSKSVHTPLVLEQERNKRILINNIITLLCAILIYSSIWGLALLTSWPMWIAILIISGITFALAYQSLWFAQLLRKKETWLYILILVLLAAEVSWCLTLWPVGFLVLGGVLFSIYFVFQGITQAHLKGELTRRIVWQHLGLGTLLLIASLTSAKWTY